METPTFLYKPNFCAECGEKIERQSWHFWTSRSFCENCETVFRASRVVPVALLGVALFFTGIFFGQAGQRSQKPPAVTTTGAAALADKPQISTPKQLTGSNQPAQPQNSVEPPKNTQPANIAKPAVPDGGRTEQIREAVYLCGARTQKGLPCSRRVKIPGRCWQHAGKPSMLEKRTSE